MPPQVDDDNPPPSPRSSTAVASDAQPHHTTPTDVTGLEKPEAADDAVEATADSDAVDASGDGDGVVQLAVEEDPAEVGWDGADDPENPRNWAARRKWAAAVMVSLFTLISPVSSSMVAPALPDIARDLGVQSEFGLELVLSVFVLAYAVGPLLLAPLSEIYGRVVVIQGANLLYLVFNLACGFATSYPQILAFRFLSGLGGSAPLAIGGGVLSDLFISEERGKAMSVYTIAPLVGPALGPLVAGYLTQASSWRWVFYATCLADVAIQLAGLAFLRETYAPVLLERKAARLRRETGNPNLYAAGRPSAHVDPRSLRAEPSFVGSLKEAAAAIATASVRPFVLLGTQPIVQVLAVYM
ncbi:hypothetical protein HK405_001110, partial [Cladochytrium tenue]